MRPLRDLALMAKLLGLVFVLSAVTTHGWALFLAAGVVIGLIVGGRRKRIAPPFPRPVSTPPTDPAQRAYRVEYARRQARHDADNASMKDWAYTGPTPPEWTWDDPEALRSWARATGQPLPRNGR